MSFAEVRYLPQDPEHYRPNIGLIGCGGISARHLEAYRKAGYRVTGLSDLEPSRASARQAEYYPDATVFESYENLLADPSIEVVDITTHPEVRLTIIEGALEAGKHVLSQKPFVLDLAEGERLVKLAERNGVKLAVNQNGRWAPHFNYIRNAAAAGLLGKLKSVTFSLQFDHNWTVGTPFDEVHHLLLYDYAIHWFDFVNVLLRQPAERVYAGVAHSGTQQATPPLLAHAALHYPDCLVTLAINGDTKLGTSDRTQVVGENAVIVSEGPDLNAQRIRVTHAAGTFEPKLEGRWFPDGFHGSMAELLCAIEENREPSHGAAQNLSSLELCFAALESANTGQVVRPGEVTCLPDV